MAQAPEQIQFLGENYQPSSAFTYQIHGRPAFTYAEIGLNGGKVLADGESMLWMDASLGIETECYGGCWASCIRECSGEACCMNNYVGTGKVTVGFELPGDMLSFGVTRGQGWLLTRAAFVAGSTNLKVSASFAGCATCCCTDEGAFLTSVTIDEEASEDNGMFLAGSYGMIERNDVPAGKKLYVSNGNFFAAHSDRELDVTMIGGLPNFCCGAGWKSIVFQFEGPCTVYTQSRNPMDLKRLQTAGAKAQAKQQQDNGGGPDGGDMGGDMGGE